jgi:hypothetical protein
MGLFSGLASALRGLFGPRTKPVSYIHKPFGPPFEHLDDETIRILDGELKGREFKLTTSVTDDEAHVYLNSNGTRIGHADIQRNAMEASVVLWNIVVRDDMRHKGLASLMANHGFRQMLELHNPASFGIRMLRLIKPQDKTTKIQNVGIGVISRKLGFSPEYDLHTLLRQSNIQLIELIETDGIMPPGYRIVLKSFPLVLIAFLVDPATDKPYPSGHRIYNSLVSPDVAAEWGNGRMIIIGNGNYILRRGGIEEMINHVAANEAEAQVYARRIRGVN